MAKGPKNSHKLMKLWLRFETYCPLFRLKSRMFEINLLDIGLKRGK
jgi:hypothetical protein